jgi:hypothetical protein
MIKTPLIAACAALSLLAAPLQADDSEALAEAMAEYLEFTEYGSSIILPEQIPAEDWPGILVIDARDAAQFEADHIPGAVNMEWREAVARRDEIPRDQPVVVLKRQGVEPNIVLTFRGPSVRLITSDRNDVPLDAEPHLDGIAEQLKAMLKNPRSAPRPVPSLRA